MKRIALALSVLLASVVVLIYATRGAPSIDVEVRPVPDDAIYEVPAPGEHVVSVGQGARSWFGVETSRTLDCSARTADPAVTGIRMELFRLDAGGPLLVARTREVPGNEPICFEHDIRDEPIGKEFLLRGTFHHADGTSEVRERRFTVEDPASFPR